MTEYEVDALNRGFYKIANAIREAGKEIAAAIRLPYEQEKEQPEYLCERCGSPRWEAGGMGDMFKKCTDCANIGDKIEA